MKWEYLVVIGDNDAVPDSKRVLDRYGLQEWELVSVVNVARIAVLKYYFKRTVQDVPA